MTFRWPRGSRALTELTALKRWAGEALTPPARLWLKDAAFYKPPLPHRMGWPGAIISGLHARCAFSTTPYGEATATGCNAARIRQKSSAFGNADDEAGKIRRPKASFLKQQHQEFRARMNVENAVDRLNVIVHGRDAEIQASRHELLRQAFQ